MGFLFSAIRIVLCMKINFPTLMPLDNCSIRYISVTVSNSKVVSCWCSCITRVLAPNSGVCQQPRSGAPTTGALRCPLGSYLLRQDSRAGRGAVLRMVPLMLEWYLRENLPGWVVLRDGCLRGAYRKSTESEEPKKGWKQYSNNSESWG